MPEELTDFSSLIDMDYPATASGLDGSQGGFDGSEGTFDKTIEELNQQQEIPQLTIDDRVAKIDSKLDEYSANNERIMTVLTTLVQRIMNPPQQQRRTEIEDEALQELGFEDPAKGRKFFNTLERNLT